MAHDFLQKFLFDDLPVKGSFVRLGSAWREIQSCARPHVSCRNLLAEALCSAALLSSNIKFRGAVSLQIQSDHFLRLLLGQCTHDGRLRGIAQVRTESSSSVLAPSVLAINLEPESGGSPYQGIVEMHELGLVPALEKYFLHSEQLQTRFWLAANLQVCGGLMLQRLPDANLDHDNWERVQSLAARVRSSDLTDLDSESLLRHLFPQDNIRLFKPANLMFGCSCSSVKVAGMLIALGEEELMNLLESRDLVEVRCEYCGRDYHYNRVEVTSLFAGKTDLPPAKSNLH